jgi:hypothetical protein
MPDRKIFLMGWTFDRRGEEFKDQWINYSPKKAKVFMKFKDLNFAWNVLLDIKNKTRQLFEILTPVRHL